MNQMADIDPNDSTIFDELKGKIAKCFAQELFDFLILPVSIRSIYDIDFVYLALRRMKLHVNQNSIFYITGSQFITIWHRNFLSIEPILGAKVAGEYLIAEMKKFLETLED